MPSKRYFVVLLFPLMACAVQWLLWRWLSPFAWFLFVPAVLFSGRFVGRWGAVGAALVSITLVRLLFSSPDQRFWLPAGLFFGMGCVLGEVQERLLRANRLADAELTSIGLANEEARTQLAAIVESSEDAIIGKTLEGVITSWNRGAEKIFGYTAEDMLGKLMLVLFPPDRHQEERRILERITSGESVNRFDTVRVCKDGRLIDISETISPIRNHKGQVIGAAKIARDVSERKRLEAELDAHRENLETLVAKRTQELRQQTRYLRAVIDNIPGMVWMKDTDGYFLAVNSVAAKVIGMTEEVLAGKTDFDIWPEQAEQYQAEDKEVMRTREQKTLVTTLPTQPGSHYETFKTPVIDEDGTVLGTVGFARDISAALQLDAAQEDARREAERLASIKSEFLANMSHEIRTPLNGVLGLARIGHRESQDIESRDTFGRILELGTLLLGITNDVLDFSKIEAGKLSVEAIPADLERVIQHAIEVVRGRAETKGIELSVETSAKFPALAISDPLRLEQILINLLSNAVKFTEQGSIKLMAECTDGYLVFRVVDTGIGMSEDQMAHLFTAFQQADSSTTRRFGGTGLGLAISKRLVALMQGEIRVTSKLGQGSRFEVSVPYVEVKQNAAGLAVSNPLPDGQRLAGISLLVAEDNEVNQMVLEDVLVNEGAQVTMVSNGKQAVERVIHDGRNAFDAVLMDIQMPGMDGFEATRCLLELAPDLPIIGQTAHALIDEREKCLAIGMVDHVTKPIDANRLYAVLSKWIAPRSAIPRPGATKSAAQAPARVESPAATLSLSTEVTDPQVIDLRILAKRFPNDQGKVVKFARKFVDTASQTLIEMDQALTWHDLSLLKTLGHRIKSAAHTVGAIRFGELCQELETLCERGRKSEAEALVHELRGLFALIVDRLNEQPAWGRH